MKDMFQNIGKAVSDALKFAGWLAWTCIKGIATVITFLIILGLLLAILPFSLVGILLSPIIGVLLLVLLLVSVYTYRHKVTTVIAVLIAFVLALVLFNSVKYSLFPDWVITKSFSIFRMHSWDKSFGMTEIENETLDTLTCYGATDLDNVLIQGPLTIYGRFNADDLKVQGPVTIYGRTALHDINFKDDFTVYGKVDLNNGRIVGETTIYGKACIEECHMNDLIVYAKKITLTSSTVKNIYMKEKSRKTTVILVGSKVEGDIVFDSGKGNVILERGAFVAGKVRGGDIIKK